MSTRNLEFALNPASVAVVGASDRPGSAGAVVMGKLVAGGFEGAVWPVSLRLAEVAGRPAVALVADLPGAPDLAIVATPAAAVPGVIAELGARGCKVAAVVGEVPATGGLRQAMLDAARPHLLRVIGPGALGMIVPPLGLDASLAPVAVAPGGLALVSQSSTVANALLERAADHGIGFSAVLSLAAMADSDAGDWLDLLAGDPRTRAILLYLETVPAPRKFLSAARAAARLKPVIAVKAGRSPQAAAAAASHTGALAGADAVVEAALARAGVLRVKGLAELFAAAEVLARFRPMPRVRLGMVTNSGGAGVLALDRLEAGCGALAELAPETLAAAGDGGHPVDLGSAAGPEDYRRALAALAADPGVDVVMALHAPVAPGGAAAVAAGVAADVEAGRIARKPLVGCFMGGGAARAARGLLREKGVPGYDTPAGAAAALGYLSDWGRLQAALLRVPDRREEAALVAATPDARARVGAIFAAVAAEGRRVLTLPEAQAVLAASGVPVPELRVAATPEEAATVAAAMLAGGGALAVKLLSRDVAHKSDVGGVALDVGSPAAAEAAARGIAARLAAALPEARLDGFALQPMVRRPEAVETILGVGRDAMFGPVILFGAGGVGVEITRDTAVALPPLDAGMAAELVARTRVGRLLAGFRGRAPGDAAALEAALIALSHLVEDFPCLRAVDVNPLLVDAAGVIALDVRIEIDPDDRGRRRPNPDLAIRPYPAEWRRRLSRPEGDYELRPIRPADALLYPAFLAKVEAEDLRMRFLAPRRSFPEEYALRLSQLDYDREMAFLALTPEGEMAGVSRIVCDPDHRVCEYALLVRSDLAGRGLGTALMHLLIEYARADGVEELEGMVLSENRGMRGLVERLGFRVASEPEDPGVVMTRLALRGAGDHG